MKKKEKTITAAPLTDRELLEEINRKQDLLLAGFGLDGEKRASPREIEDWAKHEFQKYRDRQAKKRMLKEQGGD